MRRSTMEALLPPFTWVRQYRLAWLGGDFTGGVTLAAYALPVALAYAALAGVPPEAGVYGYILGGLGYALLGSSRQLAIGPTSAISQMVGANVALMAGGDPSRHAQVATLVALAVALLCLIAWLLRLSALVKMISDSVLVGFRAGAGLTIAITQLPGLLGVPGGGHNTLERITALAGQLGAINPVTLALGAVAILLLVFGQRLLPGRPVALGVLVLAIAAVQLLGLAAQDVAVTGAIPPGLPELAWPQMRLSDLNDIFPLAAGCLLLAYIEGVSAARSLAEEHGDAVNPRQELLGLGAANFFAAIGHGYPVAGGLSQSAVNDRAGARTPLSLVVASGTLAVFLVFLTGLLGSLPKAALAAVVLTAVASLIDIPQLRRLWQVSRVDFVAAAVALAGTLVFGILQGILLAAFASIVITIARASRPHVAFLGRMPGRDDYGDMERHPENWPIPGALVFRPEASLLYVNVEHVLETVLARLATHEAGTIRLVVCDLSAAPSMDIAGARMLRALHNLLAAQNIRLAIIGAHGGLRDLLRRDGLADLVGGVERTMTLQLALASIGT